MKFHEAVIHCHVRGSIYRTGMPFREWTQDDVDRLNDSGIHYGYTLGQKVPARYPKNHPVPLADRVSLIQQMYDDWEEYDPRDDESFYMPA